MINVSLIYISPLLGYHVVFGATLNVGQRHRRRANINSALVQSILPVLPAYRYRHHEVLTRIEWIQFPSNRNICITFVQRRSNVFDVGTTLYKCYTNVLCLLGWTQPSKHEALNQCWFDAGPAAQIVGQHWTSIGSMSCLLGVLTSVSQQNGIINSA